MTDSTPEQPSKTSFECQGKYDLLKMRCGNCRRPRTDCMQSEREVGEKTAQKHGKWLARVALGGTDQPDAGECEEYDNVKRCCGREPSSICLRLTDRMVIHARRISPVPCYAHKPELGKENQQWLACAICDSLKSAYSEADLSEPMLYYRFDVDGQLINIAIGDQRSEERREGLPMRTLPFHNLRNNNVGRRSDD